jgi:hypothetical protein
MYIMIFNTRNFGVQSVTADAGNPMARCTFLDTSTSNVATGIVSTVLLKVAWSIGQAPTLHRRDGKRWQLDEWLGEVDGRCKNEKKKANQHKTMYISDDNGIKY